MHTTGTRRRYRGCAVRPRAAALLCLAGTLAAAVPATAAAGGPAAAPAETVVVDCAGEGRVRPSDYLLACGDGNNRLVGLRWRTWGAERATATGTDMVNDCVPYCAAGRFRGHPVRVTLSLPEAWPGHGGTQRFTTLRMEFTGSAPPPLPRDVTYRIVY
ncbi:hypothetical protein LG634_23135 [Streptomyces bambusae]|uniref:hypothetical protein n=1 Tax=Streptomyces bambusae TaxID=1550616 RepID=UPI001CFCA860|nr:hypothetical protein [Streptomyces bambusae]MCB5167713.1 hypothetical protein [Streptomyces bambusae]